MHSDNDGCVYTGRLQRTVVGEVVPPGVLSGEELDTPFLASLKINVERCPLAVGMGWREGPDDVWSHQGVALLFQGRLWLVAAVPVFSEAPQSSWAPLISNGYTRNDGGSNTRPFGPAHGMYRLGPVLQDS